MKIPGDWKLQRRKKSSKTTPTAYQPVSVSHLNLVKINLSNEEKWKYIWKKQLDGAQSMLQIYIGGWDDATSGNVLLALKIAGVIKAFGSVMRGRVRTLE